MWGQVGLVETTQPAVSTAVNSMMGFSDVELRFKFKFKLLHKRQTT